MKIHFFSFLHLFIQNTQLSPNRQLFPFFHFKTHNCRQTDYFFFTFSIFFTFSFLPLFILKRTTVAKPEFFFIFLFFSFLSRALFEKRFLLILSCLDAGPDVSRRRRRRRGYQACRRSSRLLSLSLAANASRLELLLLRLLGGDPGGRLAGRALCQVDTLLGGRELFDDT